MKHIQTNKHTNTVGAESTVSLCYKQWYIQIPVKLKLFPFFLFETKTVTGSGLSKMHTIQYSTIEYNTVQYNTTIQKSWRSLYMSACSYV
jgi:hypothetical protein